MQSLMISLLICSITMSVITLVYMVVTPLLAKRYSVASRYYTWIVIVVGLIIPFRPQFNNAIFKVDMWDDAAVPIVQIGNGAPIAAQIKNEIPSAFADVSFWQIAAAVWLAGMILFLAYHGVKHIRFLKLAARWSESITDEQILALIQRVKTQMGLTQNIGVQFCDSIGSPMMIGFANPRILLPKADFSEDELCFILKHEFIHYKRKDLWYKCLVLIATAVHWFNPVVYLMAKAIALQCELSCDEKVVQGSSADTRQYYSETIIGVVRYQSKLKTTFSTNFYGGKKGMKERILSIMDTKKKKVSIIIICMVIFAMAGTSFAFSVDGNLRKSAPQDESRAKFSDMYAVWDTGWYDDEFFLKFAVESDSAITEYGIQCWDSNGTEIKYIDGPSSEPDSEGEKVYGGFGYCIGAINPDGTRNGSLVQGETYDWIVYIVVDGKKYESETNSFVYTTEGSRYGQDHLLKMN